VQRERLATSPQNTEQPQRISSFCPAMVLALAGG